MPYSKLDRERLVLGKLAERKSRLDIERDQVSVSKVPAEILPANHKIIEMTSDRIKSARLKEKSVMLAFGAHTVKNGLGPVLISLMEKGWITHLATNGAGIIHDWEFAYQGKSSEDVRENVEQGKFGLWDETGFFINLALNIGAFEGLGYGESVGKMISQEGLNIPGLAELNDSVIGNLETDPDLSAASAELKSTIRKFGLKPGFMKVPHPFKRYSVQARAFELGIPFTGHPMIGHDIIYCHPMNNGASVGRTAMNDFLCFAEGVSNLDNGVYMSVGSAVMSPMVFEKSLSMARNLKIQNNQVLNDQFMVIVDLAKSDWNWKRDGEPPSDNPAYYLRYCKTFSRMGGEMFYLSMDNRDFLLALHDQLSE